MTDLRPQGKYSRPGNIVVEETAVTSHDGASVPLSIIYDKSIRRDGSNPAILVAYGAYGYSMEPYFELSRLAWLEKGGVFAVAHVRGREKGKNWYMQGLKKTKSNSWKDFIACAEYLIEKDYTQQTHNS